MSQDINNLIRQCISEAIDGPEIDALIGAIQDEMSREETLSRNLFDQLFISTASGQWLLKKSAEVGIVPPTNLGIPDLFLRDLAINVNSATQTTQLIHHVLETFYGPTATRTLAVAQNPEPYELVVGEQLLFSMDGFNIIYEVAEADFPPGTLAATTAAALSAVLTKYISQSGSQGYADVFIDPSTQLNYTRIVTGVLGPHGQINITGGALENVLAFNDLIPYPAATPVNWTTWIVTASGSTIRFSWLGNADPHLEVVNIGDIALIYGNEFNDVGIRNTDLTGSFTITAVQEGGIYNSLNPNTAAYFEITNPNAQFETGETIVIAQAIEDDLRYYHPVLFRSYLDKKYYALAWEPTDQLLRIYIPATTQIVSRGLEGAMHVRLYKSTDEFEGNWGSSSVNSERLIILNPLAFQIPDDRLDLLANGGILTVGSSTIEIDYIKRENGDSTVVCLTPHGIMPISPTNVPAFNTANSYTPGNIVYWTDNNLYEAIMTNPSPSQAPNSVQFWALYQNADAKSNEVVTISNVPEMTDPAYFNGTYIYDTTADYTLTGITGELTQKVDAGDAVRVLTVTNTVGVPSGPGYLLFDLNLDTQEEPVPVVDVLNNAFVLSPAYKFKFTHPVGSNYIYLSSNREVLALNGSDFAAYATGTAEAREYCETVINQVVAAGINLEIIILYPESIGWGYGDVTTDGSDYRKNDVIYIYAPDDQLS